MKKTIIFVTIAVLLIAVLVFFGMKNSKSPIQYETEKPFVTNIVKKTVATGKVVPLEEIEIKPKVSGIIDKIFVQEGAKVKVGDLIATIRVVPNVQSLNSAQGSVKNAQLRFDNTKTLYDRNKLLFEKGVISKQDFEAAELNFNSAKQDLLNSKNNLEIIRKGSASGMGKTANTYVKAEITGTILEIPVRKGNQVIEANTFNAGTTIATIADMTKMIFEGKVDEAEVGKIKKRNCFRGFTWSNRKEKISS
jgi:HlyD family secretion protein